MIILLPTRVIAAAPAAVFLVPSGGSGLSVPAQDQHGHYSRNGQEPNADQDRSHHTRVLCAVSDQGILKLIQSTNVHQIVQPADYIVALDGQIDVVSVAVCIQADDVALLGDEGSAGVAVIDVGVNLDHIGVGLRHVGQAGNGAGGDGDRIHIGGIVNRHLVADRGETDGVDGLAGLRQSGGHEGQGHPLGDDTVGQKDGVVGIGFRLIHHVTAHNILHI